MFVLSIIPLLILVHTIYVHVNLKQILNVCEIHINFFKVGDYNLKIHKSAYHLFSVFISKRGFSSLQTRKSFGEILSGNHRFLMPGIRLMMSYNCACLITSFIFLRNKSIVC